MATEFIARNGLLVTSGQIQGLLASGIVLSGSISSGQISNFKLSSGASLANLQSGSITSFLLSNGSVTSSSIASGNLNGFNLVSGAIRSGHCGNASISSGIISSGQIVQFIISSGALNSGHAQNNSISSGIIASGQISRNHVSSGSVFSGHIASGAVYGTVIGSGTITSGNFQFNQIGFNHFSLEVENNTPKKNNLRISVVSGVPVTSGDLTSRTTLFLVPYNGNTISLYDGSSWGLFTTSGTNVSISTAALASGNIYDVYCYANAGVPTLEFSTAWTGGITSRADAIQFVNGVPLKSGALSRRFVGTVWARQSGIIDDGRQYRGVWNWDNRVTRPMDFQETTAHTYNVSGALNARPWPTAGTGNSGNAIYWIQGIGGIAANFSAQTSFRRSTGATTTFAILNLRTNGNADPWNFIQSTLSTTLDYKMTAGAIQSQLGLNWVYAEETASASGAFTGDFIRLYNNIEG